MSSDRNFCLPSSCQGQGTGSAGRQTQTVEETGESKEEKSCIGRLMDSQHFRKPKKSKADTGLFVFLNHFIHFYGNNYWQLLNNSSRHFRGVMDHCTVSFSQYFLQYLHLHLFWPHTLLQHHLQQWMSAFTKSHLQAKRWLPLHSALRFKSKHLQKVNVSVQRKK